MESYKSTDFNENSKIKLFNRYFMYKNSTKVSEVELSSVLEDKNIKGRIIRHIVSSDILGNDREIDIYLPPSYYKNPNKTYPVLYMHDGNNLFYPSISFGGVPWQVDTTIEKLVSQNKMEEIIVVGIHNTIKRHYEYTWTPMRFSSALEGGGGKEYAKFIVNELKHFIDSNYRTSRHRKDTAVMGSSLGGLISFYLGLHHSNTFSKIGIISPSFWWGCGVVQNHVSKIPIDLDIWMDMGAKEGLCSCCKHEKNVHIENLRKIRDEFIKKGYEEGINLGYYEDQNGFHNEYSWAKRLHMPLTFFFGKEKEISKKIH